MIKRDKNFILTNVINVSKSQMKNSYFIADYSTRIGIAIKTLFLLMVSLFTGIFYFRFLSLFSLANQLQLAFASIAFMFVVGFFLILYSGFSKYTTNLRTVSILYALCQGIFVGSFFNVINIVYSNVLPIFMFALICICFLFVFMNFLYSLGFVQVNSQLKIFLIILSVCLIFFVNINLFIQNNFLGFIISIISIVVGSLELARNFAAVDFLVQNRLDAKYEWPLAFSFHMILINLFIDFIILLLRFMDFRDNKRSIM
ncbi:Bax inhibitor-1/YccA family membrane protein [Candidatus Phytoplasma bonamiae]|uniref:Bax inhibitor-1/YccA family protein n=1 Tax=Candidatus Phytoplasma bonamiae TaxID=2982626 RepID=A0ABT9D4G9_9MOLU|nr:Bax inhibitor-1/YccA family protein ['Bonamia sp.' little leaf phytoplasma]MDO8064337.1 Bax inhibitor-1/YccA family protein ['Bonamia sp.' little leaf phytoplasma]